MSHPTIRSIVGAAALVGIADTFGSVLSTDTIVQMVVP
ncbi:hypothetical protein PMI40_00444 [Herbaspirillum sp. YR522]|nr:hypothetical protein PMI40_00444 [Herbaspirillum sp. YR522]